MLRVGVCVSGGGTNLQAILDRVQDGTIRNASVELVLSNNPGAYALERARGRGIATAVVSPKSFAARRDFHKAFMETLEAYRLDLIVLAGKGHEDYQEIRGVKYPMDERVIIEELLAGGLEHI